MSEFKKWMVSYYHKDGRKGIVNVTTEVTDSKAFDYGNGKCGAIRFEDGQEVDYDLRYCASKDLHRIMLETFFGEGLVAATEEDGAETYRKLLTQSILTLQVNKVYTEESLQQYDTEGLGIIYQLILITKGKAENK